MNIDGIWTAELYGAFGWESRGVFVLDKGRIMGGDDRQYLAGTYSLSGNDFEGTWMVHYYGPPRTMFGETRDEFTLKAAGTLTDGVIEMTVHRIDKPQFSLHFRLTKGRDLPEA